MRPPRLDRSVTWIRSRQLISTARRAKANRNAPCDREQEAIGDKSSTHRVQRPHRDAIAASHVSSVANGMPGTQVTIPPSRANYRGLLHCPDPKTQLRKQRTDPKLNKLSLCARLHPWSLVAMLFKHRLPRSSTCPKALSSTKPFALNGRDHMSTRFLDDRERLTRRLAQPAHRVQSTSPTLLSMRKAIPRHLSFKREQLCATIAPRSPPTTAPSRSTRPSVSTAEDAAKIMGLKIHSTSVKRFSTKAQPTQITRSERTICRPSSHRIEPPWIPSTI